MKSAVNQRCMVGAARTSMPLSCAVLMRPFHSSGGGMKVDALQTMSLSIRSA
jgi:hypothetical protein